MEKWRALWADIETDFYRKNGYEITVEHRSFERQGDRLFTNNPHGCGIDRNGEKGHSDRSRKHKQGNQKINALIISSMERVERLTNKIAFLEKEKKAIEQEEEKEIPTQENQPDTLISMLMEWQQKFTH